MSANQIEQLRQVEDFRTKNGRRHPLWLVLLFVIIGTAKEFAHGIRGHWGIENRPKVVQQCVSLIPHKAPSGFPFCEVNFPRHRTNTKRQTYRYSL